MQSIVLEVFIWWVHTPHPSGQDQHIYARQGTREETHYPGPNNGYPTKLVKRSWQTQPAKSSALEPTTPKATVVIPYFQHLFETTRWILAPLEMRTCFHPRHTLRQPQVNLKDPIPLQQQPGVVYRIPCGTCPKVHVGLSEFGPLC